MESDDLAKVENQEFFDNEDDTELALAKVDPDEVRVVFLKLIVGNCEE